MIDYKNIEELRLKNNANTIDLLRLSFKYYPDLAKDILIKINKCDKKISTLLDELTLENIRDYSLILNDLETLRAENNKYWMEMMKLAHTGNFKEYQKLIEKANNYSNRIKNAINNE